MQIIAGPRGSGRTDALIRLAAKEFAYIIVKDHQEAAMIQRRARIMNVDIPFSLTYEEFISLKYNPSGIRAFMVDNVERLLEYIARGVIVSAITVPVPQQILHT